MFYIPNLPLAIYLAIKAKSLTFFTATNPAIWNSGNGMESKFETLQLIPEKHRPKSILIKPTNNFLDTLNKIESKKIEFPLIAKPDIGFRGLLVKKINSKKELKLYLKKYPIVIILQEFISHKNECGIFYYRYPEEQSGEITSITLKKFLTIVGNGISTLSELVLADTRASLYFEIFQEIHKSNLNSIPNNKEEIILSVIGNHSKGTKFIDGNELINKELTSTIDQLNKQINGWYYGRIDLKYDSIETLQQGKNFKILEINGIISEPTHIYDATKNSYFDAVKSIGKHWRIVYEISTKNHQNKESEYAPTLAFIKEINDLKKYTKKIKALSV